MHLEDIDQAYNPNTRCMATYRDPQGYPNRGLLLDPPQKSVTGNWFVFVGSYANRIVIDDVIAVHDTKVLWA